MSTQYSDPCKKNAQAIKSSFYFRDSQQKIKKDDTFFTEQEWNNLISHIYKAYDERKDYTSDEDEFIIYSNCENNNNIKAGKEYKNEFMSADMFNGALAKMRYFNEKNNKLPKNNYYEDENCENAFGNEYPYLKQMKASVDIIYAEYFNDLQKYANNLKHPVGSCVSCNVNDIRCCGCEGCQGCQGCNYCDAGCDANQSCTGNEKCQAFGGSVA